VDRIFAPTESLDLVDFVKEQARRSPPIPEAPERPKERSRPFLKVQDGCSNACSFCIVPRARGPSRTTREPAEVREELARLAQRGFSEVVLTGIHLGQYGADLDPPVALWELLRSWINTNDDPRTAPRLRLSSLEPLEVDPRLIDLLVDSDGAICPHLHIPIQSGDDRILEAMNRPYRSARILDLLAQLRQSAPEMALGTDLIVGFPGETEAQFEASLGLVQRSPLTHLHVFSYSSRPGTRAAELLDDRAVAAVPRPVIRRRAARLRQEGLDKLGAFASAQLGRTRMVLAERRGEDGLISGVTDNYLRVSFPGQPSWIKELVPVELLSIEGADREEVVVRGRAA
jgi:threonylcarbamoyladenosine tRNA methylthiotransferase MtaB